MVRVTGCGRSVNLVDTIQERRVLNSPVHPFVSGGLCLRCFQAALDFPPNIAHEVGCKVASVRLKFKTNREIENLIANHPRDIQQQLWLEGKW